VVTTFESYDLTTALLVKKRSGALEEFQRDKILISIARSIEHRKNISQAASELTNSVLTQLLITKPVSTIISTEDISHMTSIVLKRYDAVSAIKYLSYQAPTGTPKDVRSMLKK
jgi:transcriptional regulator NrdR family protein